MPSVQTGQDGAGVFKTLRIESMQSNQIAFEVELPLLECALKSCEPAEMATLKLSKKGSAAFLCFEIIVQVPKLSVCATQAGWEHAY